jgi:hypothetical protein
MLELREVKRYLTPTLGVLEQSIINSMYGPDCLNIQRIVSGARVYFLLMRAIYDPDMPNADCRLRRLLRDWSLFSGGSNAILGMAYFAAVLRINQTTALAKAVEWAQLCLESGLVRVEILKQNPNQYGQIDNYWIVLRHAGSSLILLFSRESMATSAVAPSSSFSPSSTIVRKFESPYAMSTLNAYVNSPCCNIQLQMAATDALMSFADIIGGSNWPYLGDSRMYSEVTTSREHASCAIGEWSALLFGPDIDYYLPVLEGASFAGRAVNIVGKAPTVLTVDGSVQRIGRTGGCKDINGHHFKLDANAMLLFVTVLGVEED